MSMTPSLATFGDLRALLHRPSAPLARWHALLFMLEDARAGGWLDEALKYAEDHMRGWDDAARAIPRRWWPRHAAGEVPAGWALARAATWNGWNQPQPLAALGESGALSQLRELELWLPSEQVEAVWAALPRWAPTLRALLIRTTAHRIERLNLAPLTMPALERLELYLPIPAHVSLAGMPRLASMTLPWRGTAAGESLRTAPPTLEHLSVLQLSESLGALLEHPICAQLRRLRCQNVSLDAPQLARLPHHAPQLEALELAHCYSARPAQEVLTTLTTIPTLDVGQAVFEHITHLGAPGARLAARRIQRDPELARWHAREPLALYDDGFRAFIDAGGLRPHGTFLWTERHANTATLRPTLEHLARSPELAHVHTALINTGDPMPTDALLTTLDAPRAHALHTLILGEEAATIEALRPVLRHPRAAQLQRIILANTTAPAELLDLIATTALHPTRVQLTSWHLEGTEHAHMSWSCDGLMRALTLGHEDIFGGQVEVFFPEHHPRAEHAETLRALLESPHMDHVHTLNLYGTSPPWALDAITQLAPPKLHTLHIRNCPEDAPIHALAHLGALTNLTLTAPSLPARESWLTTILSSPLAAQLEALNLITHATPWDTPWPPTALRLALHDAPTTPTLRAKVLKDFV